MAQIIPYQPESFRAPSDLELDGLELWDALDLEPELSTEELNDLFLLELEML